MVWVGANCAATASVLSSEKGEAELRARLSLPPPWTGLERRRHRDSKLGIRVLVITRVQRRTQLCFSLHFLRCSQTPEGSSDWH